MLHSLKKFFNRPPDWLLSGLLTLALVWVVIGSVEIFAIAIRHEYVPASFLGWCVRFLYMWGYAISLFLVELMAGNAAVSEQLISICIVLLGLVITSPVYFIIGACISTKKDSTIILASVLIGLHLALDGMATIWLVRFLFDA